VALIAPREMIRLTSGYGDIVLKDGGREQESGRVRERKRDRERSGGRE